VRAVQEIKVPLEVMVRSVCEGTKLNTLSAEKMYHKIGHAPGVQIVRTTDTASQDFGNGYDVCGPRVYTVVNPRPDFENFVLKDQNGLAGKLSFLGEEIDVGDWVSAELVSSLKWYPDVTTTTELLGLAIQGCARDELLRYGLRINNMNQLYGGTPVSLAAG